MVGQRGLLFLGTGFSVAGRLRSRDSRSECALPCMVRGYFFVPCGRWLAGLSFTKRLRITRAANADLALLLVFCRPIGCRTLVLQPLKAARLPRVHRHSLACSLSRRGLFGWWPKPYPDVGIEGYHRPRRAWLRAGQSRADTECDARQVDQRGPADGAVQRGASSRTRCAVPWAKHGSHSSARR